MSFTERLQDAFAQSGRRQDASRWLVLVALRDSPLTYDGIRRGIDRMLALIRERKTATDFYLDYGQPADDRHLDEVLRSWRSLGVLEKGHAEFEDNRRYYLTPFGKGIVDACVSHPQTLGLSTKELRSA